MGHERGLGKKKHGKQREKGSFEEGVEEPIATLPVRELCKYEKVGEKNIKEKYEAMKKCKFFEELEEAKINMDK